MQRTAGTRSFAARRRLIAMALCCAESLAGCLVTDSIEPPAEPSSPPLVLSTSYTSGSAILFDTTKSAGGLRIPIEVRDEDLTEGLKVRWRVTSGMRPATTQLDYHCPEDEIPLSGAVARSEWDLIVSNDKLPPGLCSVIEVIVSAHFLRSCLKNPEPEFFDLTTNTDNDAALGRAFFWVWEVSTNPLADNAKAQQLLSSCPTLPYQVNTPTTGITATTTQPPQ